MFIKKKKLINKHIISKSKILKKNRQSSDGFEPLTHILCNMHQLQIFLKSFMFLEIFFSVYQQTHIIQDERLKTLE